MNSMTPHGVTGLERVNIFNFNITITFMVNNTPGFVAISITSLKKQVKKISDFVHLPRSW
jgi:hypothetical protein